MLSELSIQLLTPCLLYSNMVKTLNPSILAELWLTPVAYVYYGIISFVWVYTSANFLRVDTEYCRLLSVAVFFFNTNTLPVSLLNSILSNPDAEFMFRDSNDSSEAMAARGVSYAIMFATFNNLLRWSLGEYMISGGFESKTYSQGNVDTNRAELVLLNSEASVSNLPVICEPQFSGYRNNSTQFDDTPNILVDEEIISQHTKPSFLGRINANTNNRSGIYFQFKTKALLIWAVFSPCLTMPIYAILLAVGTVMLPSLKAMLLDKSCSINVLFSAAQMCSDACIPITILTLGGQLGQIKEEEEEIEKNKIKTDQVHPSNSNEQVPVCQEETSSLVQSPENCINLKNRFNNMNMQNTEQVSYGSIYQQNNSSDLITHSPSSSKSIIKSNEALTKTEETSLLKTAERSKHVNENNSMGNNLERFGNQPKSHPGESRPFQARNNFNTYFCEDNFETDTDHIQSDGFIECGEIPTINKAQKQYSPGNKNKGVFIVLAGRFMVVPSFAVMFLVLLKTCVPNWATLLSNDPVFFFSLLVLSATPPAINLITAAQTTGLFEDDAANLLLWGYLVGIFTISLEVGGFMYLTNILFA
ncbi:putative transporter [Smittium mucronatum]|uniref:Putative transporter n=1 Tax=Smittium mucronatum TaxID=133383 RepID=A0A1R0H7S9_9FUNG|nr:putative transporter [Smittium mucronatum]